MDTGSVRFNMDEDVLREIAVSRQVIREVLRDITGAFYVMSDNVRHDSFNVWRESALGALDGIARQAVSTEVFLWEDRS